MRYILSAQTSSDEEGGSDSSSSSRKSCGVSSIGSEESFSYYPPEVPPPESFSRYIGSLFIDMEDGEKWTILDILEGNGGVLFFKYAPEGCEVDSTLHEYTPCLEVIEHSEWVSWVRIGPLSNNNSASSSSSSS